MSFADQLQPVCATPGRLFFRFSGRRSRSAGGPQSTAESPRPSPSARRATRRSACVPKASKAPVQYFLAIGQVRIGDRPIDHHIRCVGHVCGTRRQSHHRARARLSPEPARASSILCGSMRTLSDARACPRISRSFLMCERRASWHLFGTTPSGTRPKASLATSPVRPARTRLRWAARRACRQSLPCRARNAGAEPFTNRRTHTIRKRTQRRAIRLERSVSRRTGKPKGRRR